MRSAVATSLNVEAHSVVASKPPSRTFGYYNNYQVLCQVLSCMLPRERKKMALPSRGPVFVQDNWTTCKTRGMCWHTPHIIYFINTWVIAAVCNSFLFFSCSRRTKREIPILQQILILRCIIIWILLSNPFLLKRKNFVYKIKYIYFSIVCIFIIQVNLSSRREYW